MNKLLLLIVLLQYCLTFVSSAAAKPPILRADVEFEYMQRRPGDRRRATTCHFGDQTYAIDAKWKPNLGPPFGVLVCVECQCVKVQKKNRQLARVKCKNFKNECPIVTCDNPILLPDQCCKSCPGQSSQENITLWTEPAPQSGSGGSASATENTLNVIGFRETIDHLDRAGPKKPEQTDAPVPPVPPPQVPPPTKNIPTDITGIVNATEKGGKVLEDESNSIFVPREEKSYKCTWRGLVFDDGSQISASPEWQQANKGSCEACSCQRGQIKCEPILCPKLLCPNQVKVDGECCPICRDDAVTIVNGTLDGTNGTSVANSAASGSALDSTTNGTSGSSGTGSLRGCFFDGDSRFHVAGSRWHPYLPPFGFDKCSECTCHSESLTIECKRTVVCPALDCPEHVAYRINPMDCCKSCPSHEQNLMSPVKSVANPDQLGDDGQISGRKLTANEIAAQGGCRMKGRWYENGAEWHPLVQPFGEVRCVMCRCKDGRHRCRRQKCPPLNCPLDFKIHKENQCCPICINPADMMMRSETLNTKGQRNNDERRKRKRRRRKGRKNRQRDRLEAKDFSTLQRTMLPPIVTSTATSPPLN